MQTSFNPKAGRFGAHPVFLQAYLGSQTLTANTTTTIQLGAIHRRAVVSRVAIVVSQVPADSDGTITAVVKKYDASADAAVTLTSALDCEALTANESSRFTLLSTLTDAQRVADEGDTFQITFTNNSAAINTQPAGLVVTIELLVLE